jgi:ATP-dependent exoDNAse (exonuclease V) beta subunit
VALEPLTLTRNFRSQQGLVDWVNATFSSVFSPSDDPTRGAVAFKP